MCCRVNDATYERMLADRENDAVGLFEFDAAEKVPPSPQAGWRSWAFVALTASLFIVAIVSLASRSFH